MTRHSLAVLLGLALAACGTHSYGPPPAYPGNVAYNASSGDRTASTMAAEPSVVPEMAPPPSSSPMSGYQVAPSPPPIADRVERPRPEERPGLGTTFGEAHESRVRDVEFERQGDTPFSVATIYYNDAAGVSAMGAYDVRHAAQVDAPVPVRGGLTVEVMDESGGPLPSLSVGGRVYVIGEAGRRYTLRVENHTARRYEVVASVDGLDVVDGKPASLGKRGYVLDPWASLEIDGFRRSYEEVAAFRFGAVAQSYAARTTGDRNVGVIGLGFFAERGAPAWSDEEIERRHQAQPFTDGRFAQPPL